MSISATVIWESSLGENTIYQVPGSLLRSRYLGRHGKEKRCVTTQITAAKETRSQVKSWIRLSTQ